jgi:hypothetical protein
MVNSYKWLNDGKKVNKVNPLDKRCYDYKLSQNKHSFGFFVIQNV